MSDYFADSNLLIYASSTLPEDAEKRKIARLVIESTEPEISIQVLNEFTSVLTHPKKRFKRSRHEAAKLASKFQNKLPTHPLDLETRELAMRWYLPKHLSLWDSLIVASANLADCTTLYSEDMNHGQTFGNVTIVNPFLPEG